MRLSTRPPGSQASRTWRIADRREIRACSGFAAASLQVAWRRLESRQGTGIGTGRETTSLELSLALALALASCTAAALGLGQIEVKSKIGQPLLAEIPIISSDPAELEQLQARLASPETFARIGLRPPMGVIADLQFTLGAGRPRQSGHPRHQPRSRSTSRC